MHAHNTLQVPELLGIVGLGLVLFLVYVIGAFVGAWTFFGVPVSIGRVR